MNFRKYIEIYIQHELKNEFLILKNIEEFKKNQFFWSIPRFEVNNFNINLIDFCKNELNLNVINVINNPEKHSYSILNNSLSNKTILSNDIKCYSGLIINNVLLSTKDELLKYNNYEYLWINKIKLIEYLKKSEKHIKGNTTSFLKSIEFLTNI